MGTLLHGCASSEALDTSGERILIDGLDISTLDKTGVLNYEHKSDLPNQVVGKILKAHKIFKVEDCQDKHMLYFWNKIQTPFVYIVGELFDDVGHEGAKDVAAMLRYDAKNKHDKNIVNFSIEGHKLEKDGQNIVKAIARKCTITVQPCNHTAIAELLEDGQNQKTDIASIFKSESNVEILEKASYGTGGSKNAAGQWTFGPPKQENPKTDKPAPAPKAAPAPQAAPAFAAKGSGLGATKSGKNLFTHNHPADYQGFSAADHHDAMNAHYNAAMNTKDPQMVNHHIQMSQKHAVFREKADKIANRFAAGMQQARQKANIGKSDIAPEARVNGDALETEHIVKQIKTRANQAYKTFNKKEELLSFIQQKHPKLNKHTVVALAKLMLYKKEKELEEKLEKLS